MVCYSLNLYLVMEFFLSEYLGNFQVKGLNLQELEFDRYQIFDNF